MPAEWEQQDQLTAGGADWEQQDEVMRGDITEQMVGGAIKGEMKVAGAVLQAPSVAVKQAGLLRQWSWAEDVLREKDPQRQAELLKGMSESKQAFDKAADWLGKSAEVHKEGMETIIRNHPEWKSDPPESFVDLVKNPSKLGVALAESFPVLANAGILMAAGQPQIATGLMYVVEGQEAYDQAKRDNASDEDAAIAYGIYGVPAAALEKMQLEGVIKVAKGSYNALLNRTVQKVAKGELRTAAWGTIKIAAQEALEEMTQGAWGEITAKMVYDKDIPGGVVDFIDRRAQEAYIGGVMGLIPGVAGGVAGRVQAGRVEAVAAEAASVAEPVAEPVIKDEIPTPISIKSEQITKNMMGTYDTDLPPVKEGYIRLYRGQHPTKHKDLFHPKRGILTDEEIKQLGISQGKGGWFTPWLNYAANYAEAQGKGWEIAYIDIPRAVADKHIAEKAPEGLAESGEAAEYYFPELREQVPTPEVPAVVEVAPAVETPKPTKPPRITRRKALKLGHNLPKKLGWTEAQRRDFMQETVGKSSMKGMKPAEMRTLVQAMQEQAKDQGLLPPEDYPKTLFIGPREVETKAFVDEAVATVEELKDRAAKAPPMRPRKHAERRRGLIGTIKAVLVGIDNDSIPHLMEYIGAAKEGVFKEVGVTNYRRSQHHKSAVFRGGVDMLNDALIKAGVTNTDLARISASADPRLNLIKSVREAVGKGKTKYHKIKINNKDLFISMDELMDMYLASLQDTGPGHIESGGFNIRGYKTGAISETDIERLRSIVETDEKAMNIMNAVIDIADNYNAPQLNYTHGRLNPEIMEQIADKTNYWHLEPQRIRKIRGKLTHSISLLENKNILKPRTGGKQALMVRGLFPRFFTVQNAVAEYVGMAEELRLMNMILNYDPIIKSLEAKGYTKVRDNLKTLLEWVQSRNSTITSTDKLLGKILHGAYRAVLHYSPKVILSQYMSTGHYAGVVAPKYAKLLAVPPTPKLIKEMLKQNPIVWNRYYAGGQSAELAELGQLDVTLRLLTGKHADLNKMGIAAQMTDLAAFAQGWKIAKAITKDTGIQENTPEFWDAVNDKAEELWDTQPSWDKWNKSINTSQRGIKRLPFLFRSYFEKSLMMLHSADAKYEVSNKTTADRAKQAQVYGSVVGSQMATALMRTFVGWAVWRKRKGVWDYIAAMAGAPFGMVSIIGGYLNRVVGNLVKVLAGEKQKFEGEPISTLPGKTVEDFLIGLNQMADAAGYYLAGDEEKAMKQTKQGTRKLLISVGTMRGIPARQIDKIIKALESEKTTKYGGGYLL